MRSRHLAAIVGLVCTLVGCSQNGAAPPQATVINTAEAAPSAGASVAAGAHSEAQEPDGNATPTAASITPANPTQYAVEPGVKYAFSLPSGDAVCWMFTGGPPADSEGGFGSPGIVCEAVISSSANVFDRSLEVVGPPETIEIGGLGTYVGTNALWHEIPTGDLPVGKSVTVAHLTCAVLGSSSLQCSAQTGEFRYDDGVVTIVRDEPTTSSIAGAGLVCSGVTVGQESSDVVVFNGDVECPEALSVMQEYIDNGYETSGGTAAEAEIQGYLCLRFSLAESEQNGIAKFCQRDDDLIVLPQES